MATAVLRRALSLCAVAGLVWASPAVRASGPDRAQTQAKPVEKTPLLHAPGIAQPFSEADVHFMQGMIPHHAQAVKMAGWAASHGASDPVRILCERIVVGQRDEIKLMQQWLSDRGQDVPPADSMRMKMNMGGMVHEMLMPGMLSDEEMTALDKARGKEWDRLFLIGMIKHHGGAITMVDELFASYGAAQGDEMYKFASDVYADQNIEIEVMKEMLAAIKGE